MRMVVQGLSPRVQHSDRADLGAEVARISSDVAECVGGGPEQRCFSRLARRANCLRRRC
jgi:hypothetical protein